MDAAVDDDQLDAPEHESIARSGGHHPLLGLFSAFCDAAAKDRPHDGPHRLHPEEGPLPDGGAARSRTNHRAGRTHGSGRRLGRYGPWRWSSAARHGLRPHRPGRGLLHGWDVDTGHQPVLPADRRRVHAVLPIAQPGRPGADGCGRDSIFGPVVEVLKRTGVRPGVGLAGRQPMWSRAGANADDRAVRRNELGVDRELLPAGQRARPRATRWAALRAHRDVLGRLRRGRGAPGHRAVGPGRRAAGGRGGRLEAAGADSSCCAPTRCTRWPTRSRRRSGSRCCTSAT